MISARNAIEGQKDLEGHQRVDVVVNLYLFLRI